MKTVTIFFIGALTFISTSLIAQKTNPDFYTPRNSKIAEESGWPINLFEQHYWREDVNKMGVLPIEKINNNLNEERVRDLEETYWEFVKRNDLMGYRTLWDEDLGGWSHLNPNPLYKGNIADWISPLHEKRDKVYDYQIEKMEVRAFGDVVVAHCIGYHVWRNHESGEILEKSPTFRITHTWANKMGSWKIIAGRSSDDIP